MRWWIVLLALFVISCAGRVPTRAADITGQITRATTGVVSGSRQIMILVEAVPNDLSGSAKALVTVDRNTRIFHENASVAAKVEDLLPGTRVSVWFEGPVAESYPVQARAGTLLIMTKAGQRPPAEPRDEDNSPVTTGPDQLTRIVERSVAGRPVIVTFPVAAVL